MRTELELRYKAENIIIQSRDGVSIDCMYLKAEAEDVSKETKDSECSPVVVMCNPNGEYYEYAIDMQDHWLEFYAKNGINVLLWNYRGYSRSQGYPTPSNLLSDAETIVQHLRKVKTVAPLLLHGQSLGGVVASHVAAKLGCDLLFADRAFSCLENVAEATVGGFLTGVMKAVTGWCLDCTTDFLSAQCYKIVSSDPNDAIVSEIASLKSGIAERVGRDNTICGRLALSDSEVYVLYRNITDLYDAVREFDAVPKRRVRRRKGERTKSQDLSVHCEARVRTLSDGELNLSNEDVKGQLNGRASTCVNESEYIVSAEYTPPKKYKMFMKEGNKQECSAVLNILNAVKDEIDKLDSAGSTISRIMQDKQKHQLKLLKGFFVNLDVWGSQPPVRTEGIVQPLPTLAESRMRAYVRFPANSRAR